MKKNSKYVKYIAFAFILCVTTTGNVFASCSGVGTACKECTYSFDYIGKNIELTLRAVDQGNGNIVIDQKKIDSRVRGFELGEFNVYGSSFKSKTGNKLYCPTLYYDVQEPINMEQNQAVQGNNVIKISTNKNNGYLVLMKGTENSNDIPLAESTKNTVTCAFEANVKDYGCNVLENQTITFNVVDGKLPTKEATEEFNLSWNGVTAEDIIKNGKCNFNGYLVCQKAGNSTGTPNGNAVNYNPTCTFSKQPKICTDSSEIKKPEKLDKEENNNTAVGAGGLGFGNDVGECKEILDEILDHAQTLFNWLKILAPILVILFGALDFAKATIAMDDKGMKTAMSKFPKRLIAAAALFFLPYLINLVLSLPGIGIEDAVCGIGKVVIKI